MLREAGVNANRRQLTNTKFINLTGDLAELNESFDFVNSFIVFQHIPCVRGQRLFWQLVQRIKPGGIGVVHITYSKSAYGETPFGYWLSSSIIYPMTLIEEFRYFRPILRIIGMRRLKSLLRRKPKTRNRQMQMNAYTLNPLLHLLQVDGVRRVHLEFTDHGGELGAVLFFQKAIDDGYRF